MTEKTTERWVTSNTEEVFHGEEYASREEAIAGAPEEHELEEDASFWVGRVVPSDSLLEEMISAAADAEAILERLSLYLFDNVGEAAEDWDPASGKADVDLLKRLVEDAVRKWFDNDPARKPAFFRVDSVSEHRAPRPAHLDGFVERVVLIGRPGSGKGTMAKLIAERLGIEHVSSGEIFREAARKDPNLEGMLSSGALIPDEETCRVVFAHIEHRDAWTGFVLDGFPRTVPQTIALNAQLKNRECQIQRVLVFDAPDDVLYARLKHRAEVEGRPEDVHDPTIRNRMRAFAEETALVIPYYDLLRVDVLHVDATGTPEEQFERVLEALKR